MPTMPEVSCRPLASANPLPPAPQSQGWLWLLLPCLALWPVWEWSAARLTDGSDDPLGIVAMLTLLALVARDRHLLASTPRPLWLGASLTLCILAGPYANMIPPLLRAAAGVCGLLMAVLALRQRKQALLAWFGLGILALPLMSSLQFFAGYPLRIVTAEISTHLLHLLGISAAREGTTLDLGGRLVMVDAPCSGIQMAWSAYFTACTTAAWLRLPDRIFLRRLPLLGALVLAGNVLRNTVLVIKESGILPLPAWTHEGIGLLVFAGVCVLVLRLMARPFAPAMHVTTDLAASRKLTVTGLATFGIGFALAAILPFLMPRTGLAATPANFTAQWPESFNGRLLRPLPLSEVEKRFAAQFPGAIARFSDGISTITLRDVTRATRKLHPAADCYKGLGYRVSTPTLSVRPNAQRAHSLQRCFIASKNGRDLLVCEYIEDQAGRSYTDTSAWYWAAVAGQSGGPWRAVTTARLQ
jgi:exosortase/archaeosortase family protein